VLELPALPLLLILVAV
jgi:hypothetical protein